MKTLLYLFLFVLILGGVAFGFFTMTAPEIPQTPVVRNLDPKEAFGAPPPPAPVSPSVDTALPPSSPHDE